MVLGLQRVLGGENWSKFYGGEMKRGEAELLLKRSLDDDSASFHKGQWEAIDTVVNGKRKVLIVQRTGWGKSTVYFISTGHLRDQGAGPTLIVSPLLALMRNQIEAADRLGLTAATINSSNTEAWEEIEERIVGGEVDVLLISPERLANEKFLENVLSHIADRLGLMVIDEAHCISDWGHDFRPDYQRLSQVLRRLPENVPVICTTATANDRVIVDIQDQLGNIDIQRVPLMRDSLALQTIRLPDRTRRLAWLADHLPGMPGTGIVYTLTIRDAEQVAAWLNDNGIKSAAYHGSVKGDSNEDSSEARLRLESMLFANEVKALVATSALGMGYDKPDLGFVVHYQAPSSIISYYQQVGRAGRGIDHALGILLAGAEDDEIQAWFRRSAFPDERDVESILNALEDSDGSSIFGLQDAVNIRHGQIEAALKFLAVQNPAPVIKDGPQWRRTAVDWQMGHDHIRRLTDQREREWQELQDYVDASGCLMEFLARRLDDPNPQPCGRCAICLGEALIPADVSHETAVKAARFLRRCEITIAPKKLFAPNGFPKYGWRGRIPEKLRAEEGRILGRWGDAGWGQMVAEDKQAGHFRDDLVHAAATMVKGRWRPEPAPTWVTCVPSNRHPELVPDFAHRLAVALNLPFRSVLSKVRDNRPQKEQQNRYHQSRNLDGAFGIEENVETGPVLLVDDAHDSGWTMTVAAVLLRQAGSGPVYPLALASTGPGD